MDKPAVVACGRNGRAAKGASAGGRIFVIQSLASGIIPAALDLDQRFGRAAGVNVHRGRFAQARPGLRVQKWISDAGASDNWIRRRTS
jgi:hypothetical protein